MGRLLGFLKVWRWAVGRTLDKEGKKIKIFQSLGVADNAGMVHSVAEYGINTSFTVIPFDGL